MLVIIGIWPHQGGLGDLEVQHVVDAVALGRQHAVQLLRLHHIAREAVQHEAYSALRLLDLLLHVPRV